MISLYNYSLYSFLIKHKKTQTNNYTRHNSRVRRCVHDCFLDIPKHTKIVSYVFVLLSNATHFFEKNSCQNQNQLEKISGTESSPPRSVSQKKSESKLNAWNVVATGCTDSTWSVLGDILPALSFDRTTVIGDTQKY